MCLFSHITLRCVTAGRGTAADAALGGCVSAEEKRVRSFMWKHRREVACRRTALFQQRLLFPTHLTRLRVPGAPQAFVDRRGLQILVEMLIEGKTPALQAEAAAALYELATKANATASQDFTPSVPQPPVRCGTPPSPLVPWTLHIAHCSSPILCSLPSAMHLRIQNEDRHIRKDSFCWESVIGEGDVAKEAVLSTLSSSVLMLRPPFKPWPCRCRCTWGSST